MGSACFLVASALAGYISPSTGQLRNEQLSHLGTFIGALLAGALLLLPERSEEAEASYRTLMARAMTSVTRTIEQAASSIMRTLAHGLIAEMSVGLTAVEVQNDSER